MRNMLPWITPVREFRFAPANYSFLCMLRTLLHPTVW